MVDSRVQDVLDAVRDRAAAIGAGDFETLAACMSEDYLHVHGDGRIGDKADYVAGVKRVPREVESEKLDVRLFGNVAVLTGGMVNHFKSPDREPRAATSVTFVLQEMDGRWIFVSGHLTRKPAA